MKGAREGVVDLVETYLQLRPDFTSREWKSDEFWSAVREGKVEERGFGLLVSAYSYDEDWKGWEAHPAGDEVVCLLEGEMELVLEVGDGERRVPLRAGETAVVPRGVWHRAEVRRACRALHITPGDGTEHRPIR